MRALRRFLKRLTNTALRRRDDQRSFQLDAVHGDFCQFTKLSFWGRG